MDFPVAAETQRVDNISQNANENEATVWWWWQQIRNSNKYEQDIWLQQLKPDTRESLISTFAAAPCFWQFSEQEIFQEFYGT